MKKKILIFIIVFVIFIVVILSFALRKTTIEYLVSAKQVINTKANTEEVNEKTLEEYWRENLVSVNETEKNIKVNNWDELNNVISSDIYEYDENQKILKRNVLNITLNESENWNVDKLITINDWQKVILLPQEGKEIVIKRAQNYKGGFITSNGNLSLGNKNATGTLIFDGNAGQVQALQSLLGVSKGILNMYNTTFRNNNSNSNGGGLKISSADVKIEKSNIDGNTAKVGGGIYVADTYSKLELNNVSIKNNTTTTGSGGGIYTYGDLSIYGNDTKISNNVASTYGGGIMIKTKATINAGEISDNKATQNAGGGIRVDGDLILNGGTITGNYAKTTGGGIDYTVGFLYLNSGTIENNVALEQGNDMWPDGINEVDWTQDESLNLQEIDMNLLKSFNKGEEIPLGTLQGSTLTNKYIIFAQVASNDENTILNIVDRNTLELLNTVDSYCFKHANDLAYNPNTDEIYIITSSKNIAKFKINDNYELVDLNYIECSRIYSGIAYDIDDNYFIGYCGKRIYVMNNEFKELYNFEVPTNLTTQGISYLNHQIYFCCTENGVPSIYQKIYNHKEKNSNLIYVYDIQGKLDRTLYIPNTVVSGEIESLAFYDDNSILMGYNKKLDGKNVVSFYTSNYISQIEDEYVEKLTSTKYTVDEEQKIITDVELETTVDTFKTKISGVTNYTIKDKNGKTLSNSDYIPTGGVLETSVGNYTLIVRGDLNGDGSLKLNDLAQAQRIYLELAEPEELKVKSADLNKNGKIDLNDLSKLQKIYLGI